MEAMMSFAPWLMRSVSIEQGPGPREAMVARRGRFQSARAALGACAVVLLLSGWGCGARPEAATATPASKAPPGKSAKPDARIREAAVAGLFYPADEASLPKAVERLLAGAPPHYVPRLKALICPHAGYEFSGPTAATGYRTLAGRDIRTVIILAPSHYALFDGVSIPDAQAYQTPLGLARISDKAAKLAGKPGFVTEPRCAVQRPPWWRQAPKRAPEPGHDTPETWEHSAEVQVPFIQKVLRDTSILPLVFGQTDPEQVARALAEVLDDQTVLVASSDLSHYHPYDTARRLDEACVNAICNLDVDLMKKQEACGEGPILTLLHLARLKGWKAQRLDYRNSGDTSGDKSRVVGYAAVAFHAPGPERYDAADRRQLLELSRQTLRAVVTQSGASEPAPKELPPRLAEKRACFVTLTKRGSLRGCIGHILPQESLWQAVVDNTRNAALRDPRFPPVQPDELPDIHIEISVLTEPEPLKFDGPEDLLRKLQPYEDGVVLKIGERSATFLPQVWAQIPDRTDFLNQLAVKAGCPPSAWRGKETTVAIYHAECFGEP
jgi:hypothetical protein